MRSRFQTPTWIFRSRYLALFSLPAVRTQLRDLIVSVCCQLFYSYISYIKVIYLLRTLNKERKFYKLTKQKVHGESITKYLRIFNRCICISIDQPITITYYIIIFTTRLMMSLSTISCYELSVI